MKTRAKEKLIVFAVSFAFFALGVYAVYMDRGATRTTILATALAGLLSVAAWQTLRKLKNR